MRISDWSSDVCSSDLSVSLPLGVLRIPEVRGEGNGWLERHVKKLLQKCGWDKATRDLPFYLVGGSWRALARLDMHLTGFPLPVIHHYEMTKETPARLAIGRANV